MYIHQGVGNLGTHSVIRHRARLAEVLDFPWEQCRGASGATPAIMSRGAQSRPAARRPTRTRAPTMRRHAGAKTSCRSSRRSSSAATPDAYRVGGDGVAGPGGSLTWAQAAERAIKRGGKFDGHELPADINAMTKASGPALAGLGLMRRRARQLSARRPDLRLRRWLRRSRSRRRNRRLPHRRLRRGRRRRNGDQPAQPGWSDSRRRASRAWRTRAARSWSTTLTTASRSASGCIRTGRRRFLTVRST